MLSVFTNQIPRTRTAHLQTLRLDDGASLAWFERRLKFAGCRHSSLVAINRLPPQLSGVNDISNNGSGAASSMTNGSAVPSYPGPSDSSLGPPLHYHISQDETFVVTEGSAVFYTFPSLGFWTVPSPQYCKTDVLNTGQIIKIPKGMVHTFRNASSQHTLEVEFSLDPPVETSIHLPGDGHVEEVFFRNTWSYRADVKAAGVERSLLQVLCFNRPSGVVLMLPSCGVWTSWLIGTVGAAVGRWVMGYRSVYDEYAPAAMAASSKTD